MRAALNRALNRALNKAALNRVLNNDLDDLCNQCRTPYNKDSGDILEVFTGSKVYKVWYCDDCLKLDIQVKKS